MNFKAKDEMTRRDDHEHHCQLACTSCSFVGVTNQTIGARCAVAADFDGDSLMDLVSASLNRPRY